LGVTINSSVGSYSHSGVVTRIIVGYYSSLRVTINSGGGSYFRKGVVLRRIAGQNFFLEVTTSDYINILSHSRIHY
jgi:hypothetical protein